MVVSLACLGVAVVAGFLGLLYGSEFAAGERAPVPSALFWGVSAFAAAVPVGLLPSLGFPARRGVSLAVAGVAALVWFVVGYVLSAQ